MIIKSLEEIALKEVCLDLPLNYEICIKNNWKIPKKIGDDIFKYSINFSKPLNTKKCRIFQSNITELSEFSVFNRIFEVDNYDFLNGHHFINLYFRELKNFHFLNPDFRITTKNFSFSNMKIRYFDWSKFFQNSLIVEESLTLKYITSNTSHFKAICGLIEKCGPQLKELTVIESKMKESQLSMLTSEIFKLTNLEKFKFRVSCGLKESEGNSILNSLINTAENLQVLKINFLFSNETLYSLIKHMGSLKKIKLQFKNSKDLNTQAKVFKILRKQFSSSLIGIDFVFEDMNKIGRIEFLKLLDECTCLEKINIVLLNKTDVCSQYIASNLYGCSHTLKSFNVFPSYPKQFTNDINKLFESCPNLKKINLKTMRRLELVLPSVNIAVQNSKNTLAEIQIHDFNTKNLKLFLPNVTEIVCLKKFTIEESIFCSKSVKVLRKLIETHWDNLTDLTLSQCFEYCHVPIDLLITLTKCSKLRTFDFSFCSLRGKLKYLINNSCLFLKTIESLCLGELELTDQDLSELGKSIPIFLNLHHLELAGNRNVSTRAMNEFTNKMSPIMQNLNVYFQPGVSSEEEYNVMYGYDSEFESEDEDNSDGASK